MSEPEMIFNIANDITASGLLRHSAALGQAYSMAVGTGREEAEARDHAAACIGDGTWQQRPFDAPARSFAGPLATVLFNHFCHIRA